MKLRGYQIEALDEIKRLFIEGKKRQLLSLPTGLGKTIIFTQVHRALSLQKRVLVIAHRRELVCQARGHYQDLGYRFRTDHTDDWYENVSTDRKIWIASVQSLAHLSSSRLRRLRPDDFDLVVCDEAHHSVANTYLSVCRHFGITDRSFAGLFLGVTATPARNDRRSLGELFDVALCPTDTFKAIQDGWLVPIRYLQARSSIQLDLAPAGSGDFNLESLGNLIDKDVRNSLIVKAWKERAGNKRTIVFCATVQHAADVASTFESNGILAQVVHGRLRKDIREIIIEKHKNGDFPVLANCGILTEGYDDPGLECIIMARPTQSKPLYVQMIGRGLRIPEGIDNLKDAREEGTVRPETKSECIIIDVVDNWRRHDLEIVTALSLFGEGNDDNESSGQNNGDPNAPPPAPGRAADSRVTAIVRPMIEEVDLFANRRSPVSKTRSQTPDPPNQMQEGPLSNWLMYSWNDDWRKTLHENLVSRWMPLTEAARTSFCRTLDPELKIVISPTSGGRWTLSVKALDRRSYSRTFRHIFDAFRCAEWFAFGETGRPDPITSRRSNAVMLVQKSLLSLNGPITAGIATFAQAKYRVMQSMGRS